MIWLIKNWIYFIIDIRCNNLNDEIKINLLSIRSVDVQGDSRSYKYVCAIHTYFGWTELIELAHKIPEQINEINRVIYVFPDNLNDDQDNGYKYNYVKIDLNKENIDLLRMVDNISENIF